MPRTTRQQFSRIQYELFVSAVPVWSKFLSFLCVGLWSAVKSVYKGALPGEYLSHNFDEHGLEDTYIIWCLAYPSEKAPFPGRYIPW